MSYTKSAKNQTANIFAGVITATVLTLLLALVLALVCWIFKLSLSVIKPVNQFIKVIAIFSACLISVKGQAGYLKGLIVGVFTAILSCLVMSFFGGKFADGLLIEVLFGGAIGLISGVIAVNIKNKS